MIKGIKLLVSGKYEIVEIEDNYKELQEIVGGLIEFVSIGDGIDIVINEEGKIMGLEPNFIATALFDFKDLLVGDAIIVGVDYSTGETISLTDAQIETLTNEIKCFVE